MLLSLSQTGGGFVRICLRTYGCALTMWMVLCPSTLWASSTSFVLQRDTQLVPLKTGLRVLEDPEGTLKLGDVRARLEEFTDLPVGVPNFGYTDSAFWFVVDFDNRDRQEEWVLEIGYPPLDDVAVYVESDGGFAREYVGGDKRPFGVRHRPYRTINFGLELPARKMSRVWLRVATGSSFQLPLALHSERHFGDEATKDMAIQGLLFGTFFIMILFNGLVWFRTRDSGYLVLVGFLVF